MTTVDPISCPMLPAAIVPALGEPAALSGRQLRRAARALGLFSLLALGTAAAIALPFLCVLPPFRRRD